ncbi:H-X9-DG-CTERM domain-containing protein [Tundrisphaera sp. TA3]|uniref:H-X9-DG-CTERM domain-containing protein n=1 Tax=Tundrisphaera sp. TA3 TaxID=3435775 RepID=UPI003EBBEB0E
MLRAKSLRSFIAGISLAGAATGCGEGPRDDLPRELIALLLPNNPLTDVFTSATCVPPPPGSPRNPLNPPCIVWLTAAAPSVYGARSRHTGGLNVVMADGSVRFIKNTISYNTWMALSTTQGGEIINADAL